MKITLTLTEMLEKTNAAKGAVYNKIAVQKTAREAADGEVISTMVLFR